MYDTTSPPQKAFRWLKKSDKRFAVFVLALLFLYHVPLIQYFWRVGNSVAATGLSRETARSIASDSEWFLRFFTGPPSDAEMKAFFERNRPAFERLAYLYATSQCDPGPETPTCKVLAEQLGVSVYAFTHVNNTAYTQSREIPCRSACKIQEYSPLTETQNWWRSTNSSIDYWEKKFLYVPPLLPAQAFGLDPNHHPAERDEVVRRLCRYPRYSLDIPVPELEAEPVYADECGYRPLGDGWYLLLSAGYNLGKGWF
jgi:hypothetical protein